MDDRAWLSDYFARYRRAVDGTEVYDALIALKDLLLSAKTGCKKVIIAGNGGSAATASHCAVDLTKNAGVRAVTFNEASLVTCFANDFGYERWLEKAIEFYGEEGDVVILLSVSGRSPNMVRAAQYATKRKLIVVTFTGCASDNPLRAVGQLNFWVDSRAYNVVEMTHHIWLLAVCDLIIGRAEYPPSR